MPRQDSGEIEYVEPEKRSSGGALASAATATIVVIFQTMLVGALSQLWGLINGLSLFVHLPMTGVDIPEHTLSILSQLIGIAQFDIVENELVYGWLIPFEEDDEDLLRENIVTTGYESNYAFVNMGTNVIIITILLFFKGFLLCTIPVKHKDTRVGRFHRKCSGIMFWNFWLRMLIQGCLEILISAVLYVIMRSKLVAETGDYNMFLFVNDIMSFALIGIFIFLPPWVLYFYYKNFDRVEKEEFTQTYGSAIDSLRGDTRWIIFFPVYFLVRRTIFMIMTLWLTNGSIFQL